MASTDWTVLTNSIVIGSLDRGVTGGLTPPNGGGSFVYGFNSLEIVEGAAALFTNQAGYAPTPAMKGGSIRGAVQRGLSGGTIGFSPFLFIGLQGPAVEDLGYFLGLSDGDPSHIVLRKGTLIGGIPDLAPDPDVNGILRRSTATIDPEEWVHLRLDMIVNGTGDVVLNCYRSDLDAELVTAPDWVAIPGMASFIDDALQVNTGSAPYTSGRMGFGFQVEDTARRGFFDQLEALVQV